MKYLSRVFTPSGNRRLNELIGFLLFVSAALLFLALVSYSPLDPSLNTAASAPGPRPARNWVGMVGAGALRCFSFCQPCWPCCPGNCDFGMQSRSRVCWDAFSATRLFTTSIWGVLTLSRSVWSQFHFIFQPRFLLAQYVCGSKPGLLSPSRHGTGCLTGAPPAPNPKPSANGRSAAPR